MSKKFFHKKQLSDPQAMVDKTIAHVWVETFPWYMTIQFTDGTFIDIKAREDNGNLPFLKMDEPIDPYSATKAIEMLFTASEYSAYGKRYDQQRRQRNITKLQGEIDRLRTILLNEYGVGNE